MYSISIAHVRHTHSERILIAILTAAICSKWSMALAAPLVQPDRIKPNIVIVLVDDMGYSDLGCYGSEIKTPNIDRLAAGGVRFTQFYNTAKCYTSRASLLTGLYHHQVLDQKTLNRNGATIAELLRSAGYQTMMSGKWHLNGEHLDDHTYQPPSRGFDHFFGTIVGANSYFNPFTLQRGYERISPTDNFYYTDAITADAIESIRRYTDKGPFFQYVCYTAPHWPMHLPNNDQAISKYRKIYSEGWDLIRNDRFRRQRELGLINATTSLSSRDPGCDAWKSAQYREWQIERMAVYAAMVERLDRGIGEIADALRDEGVLEDTLLLFLSDNGGSPEDISQRNGVFTLGGQATTRDGRSIKIGNDPSELPGSAESYQGVGREWANVNNTPFRLFKSWSHEGGIATPLIAHWPNGIARRGAISHQVGHVIDMMPTCLAAAKAEYTEVFGNQAIEQLEGRSMLRAMRSDHCVDRTLYWEYASRGAMRQGDWKLVSPSLRDRDWELYDLATDRAEVDDKLAEEPERAKSMIAMYDSWASRVGVKLKKPKVKAKLAKQQKGKHTKRSHSMLDVSSANGSPQIIQEMLEVSTKRKKRDKKGEKRKGKKSKDNLEVHSLPPEEPRILFKTDSYTLTDSSITEGKRTAYAYGKPRPRLINCNKEMIRPNLRRKYPTVTTGLPIVDTLYQIALSDLEMNIVEDEKGAYFRVSPDFPNMIFTRDTAYSSYLGAAYVMPDVVQSHLEIARSLRRDLAFKCPNTEEIPLTTVPNEPEPLTNYEFYEKYGTNSYARRTDDPCWVIGYWTAISTAADREKLLWLVDQFKHFDEHFYTRFYDRNDGLYFGQASFIDVGGTGYPPGSSIQYSLACKALSTNCLYVGALDRISRACRLLNLEEDADEYQQRADKMRCDIRKAFRHPDGYYAYYIDPDGQLQARREQLGMAFCVLFDVLSEEEFATAIDGYEVNDFGSPVFFPFYDAKKVYHNRAIWPFAEGLFYRALQKRHRSKLNESDVVMRALGNFSRNALWGNFAEVLDYKTGGWNSKHARNYIWSASGYLSVIFHMLAGIDVEDGATVRFSPHLPKAVGGRLDIDELKLAGMTIDLRIKGHGSTITSCLIDGEETPQPVVVPDGKEHRVEITLGP